MDSLLVEGWEGGETGLAAGEGTRNVDPKVLEFRERERFSAKNYCSDTERK